MILTFFVVLSLIPIGFAWGPEIVLVALGGNFVLWFLFGAKSNVVGSVQLPVAKNYTNVTFFLFNNKIQGYLYTELTTSWCYRIVRYITLISAAIAIHIIFQNVFLTVFCSTIYLSIIIVDIIYVALFH